jgi:sedoheptulose-bisphosphatase
VLTVGAGEGKLIAPGNLRATQDNEGYSKLFNYWLENTYQLRYTGGMVPDVNQLMVKVRHLFDSSTADCAQRITFEIPFESQEST